MTEESLYYDAWFAHARSKASKERECTSEDFLKDIKNHKIHIVKDDGIHRHIKCNDGSSTFSFEIVTFPGYLAIVGDMGSYTWWRVLDMFAFFRRDDLSINDYYWLQKLETVDRTCGSNVFSMDALREAVLGYCESWFEDISEDKAKKIWDEVYDRVISVEYSNEYEARESMNNFACEVGGRTYEFTDLWEHSFTRPSFHVIWCMYAIVWAIARYDEAKALVTP